MKSLVVDVVIPALNEEEALPHVLRDIPKDRVRHIVVADNGSTDATASKAKEAGARVVYQPEKGYGAACLLALDSLREDPPDIVVFLDGDYSDFPAELLDLIAPIEAGEAELVIGSRTRGNRTGGLTPQQKVGNAVACTALRWLYGADYTDLGPFRAIKWSVLEQLSMRDRNWGWTVEMQIRAAQQKVVHTEVPVSYRERIGVSKVSGTLSGTFNASRKILWLLAKHILD